MIFHIETSFFIKFIRFVSALAITPNLIPGPPYDFDMLLMTIRLVNSSKILSCSKVLFVDASEKSTNDSSIINCMFLFFVHCARVSSSLVGIKFPEGLSGFTINKEDIFLFS